MYLSIFAQIAQVVNANVQHLQKHENACPTKTIQHRQIVRDRADVEAQESQVRATEAAVTGERAPNAKIRHTKAVPCAIDCCP